MKVLDRLYPSLICAEQSNLGKAVEELKTVGLKNLHIDVMDGVFVPRFGMYPEQLTSLVDVALDVHLMCKNPRIFIDATKKNDSIVSYTIHPEAVGVENLLWYRDMVLDQGKKFGIAVNLSSDTHHIARLLQAGIHQITFMGIHPGVLAQKANVSQLKRNIEIFISENPEQDGRPLIQVDGGVTLETIPELDEIGVDTFVCGSSTLYKGGSTLQVLANNLARVAMLFDPETSNDIQ